MNGYDRQVAVRQWNADVAHQRMAGLASWAAFSARWRARQGLPLLHPMDVQYLTPGDFCNGHGCPLSPEVQRRLFREYVSAAVQSGQVSHVRAHGSRSAGIVSAELGLVRAGGFVRWVRGCGARADYEYGRPDVAPYAPDALLPARPYGVPVVSPAFAAHSSYWLDGHVVSGDEDGADDSWIDAL
jgi:hypothetical protein